MLLNETSTGNESGQIDDLDLYIEQRLGARHLPLTTIIPISIVYATIFIVGVLGNVSTCLVIMKNKYMQTPTNVYLANLAISDLLTHLVAMPFEVYLLWRQYPWVFGEFVCDAKMLATETVTYSSILTIVAFTIERYLAICHPLSIPRKSKMTRALRALVLIWIISVAFSLPWIFYNKVNYLVNEVTHESIPESAWCAVPWNEDSSKTPLYFMIGSTMVGFIFPITLVTVLYFKIGLAMKRSSNLQRCAGRSSCVNGSASASNHPGGNGSLGVTRECPAEATFNKGRQAVIRMLVAVVLVFFICWTPFHAQRLMFVIVTLNGTWTKSNGIAHHVLFLASGVGYYLSSSVNPLLYSVMSKRFRRGFKDMLRRSINNAGQGQPGTSTGLNNTDPDRRNRFSLNKRRRETIRYPLQKAPRNILSPRTRQGILRGAFGDPGVAPTGSHYPQSQHNNGNTSNSNNHSANNSNSSSAAGVVITSTPMQQHELHHLHNSDNANHKKKQFGPIMSTTRDAQLVVRWNKRPDQVDTSSGSSSKRKDDCISCSLSPNLDESSSLLLNAKCDSFDTCDLHNPSLHLCHNRNQLTDLTTIFPEVKKSKSRWNKRFKRFKKSNATGKGQQFNGREMANGINGFHSHHHCNYLVHNGNGACRMLSPEIPYCSEDSSFFTRSEGDVHVIRGDSILPDYFYLAHLNHIEPQVQYVGSQFPDLDHESSKRIAEETTVLTSSKSSPAIVRDVTQTDIKKFKRKSQPSLHQDEEMVNLNSPTISSRVDENSLRTSPLDPPAIIIASQSLSEDTSE